jgi:glycosyltransferase involved in cell wall biosynthesis
MRIAHVTATFPPYYAGTGIVCYHNALEMARRGHEVTVFTAGLLGAQSNEVINKITIHRLRPIIHLGNAAMLPQLSWSIRGFDVMHLHYPFFGGEFAILAAKLTRTPKVITYHNDVILPGWRGKVEKILRWTVGKATLRSADRLLFTSQDYGQASLARAMLHGLESVIGILPNGVDTITFCPGNPPQTLIDLYQLTSNDRVALLVARLDQAHYFKGVHIFLEALAQISPFVKGIIVGDGDLRTSYEEYAHNLGIASKVFFAGYVKDESLPDFYRLAYITVLPSVTMGEAFGLVLLESFACGTPVIASNLPGVRSVVSEEKDGFLVKPGDVDDLARKIQTSLDDPERRHVMGIYGREKVVTKYAWSKVVDQLEDIYIDIIKASKI